MDVLAPGFGVTTSNIRYQPPMPEENLVGISAAKNAGGLQDLTTYGHPTGGWESDWRGIIPAMSKFNPNLPPDKLFQDMTKGRARAISDLMLPGVQTAIHRISDVAANGPAQPVRNVTGTQVREEMRKQKLPTHAPIHNEDEEEQDTQNQLYNYLRAIGTK